ncbi:hypothetical protein [Staphylococcus epidermidis]
MEGGIALRGSEIKCIGGGSGNLKDRFGEVRGGEM